MTKPPFPIGLTLDEALQRGWRPSEGRALIATKDGPIREAGPFDDAINLFHRQLSKRRRPGDSTRDRISAAMNAAARAADLKRHGQTVFGR